MQHSRFLSAAVGAVDFLICTNLSQDKGSMTQAERPTYSDELLEPLQSLCSRGREMDGFIRCKQNLYKLTETDDRKDRYATHVSLDLPASLSLVCCYVTVHT